MENLDLPTFWRHGKTRILPSVWLDMWQTASELDLCWKHTASVLWFVGNVEKPLHTWKCSQFIHSDTVILFLDKTQSIHVTLNILAEKGESRHTKRRVGEECETTACIIHWVSGFSSSARPGVTRVFCVQQAQRRSQREWAFTSPVALHKALCHSNTACVASLALE